MEVGQRKRKEEGLRRESESPRSDLKVQVLACPAIDLVGLKASSAAFALLSCPQLDERNRSDQAGGVNTPVFAASSPQTEWCHAASIWKWKGAMSVEEPRMHEVVRVSADLGALPGRAVEEASDGGHGLQERGHADIVE